MTITPLLFIFAMGAAIVGGLWLGLELGEAGDVKEAWQNGYATGYEDGNGDRINRLQIDYPNSQPVQDAPRTCARCGNRSSNMRTYETRGPLCSWCYDLHVAHGLAVSMPDTAVAS